MRILFLLPSCNYGGPERFVSTLINHFQYAETAGVVFVTNYVNPSVYSDFAQLTNVYKATGTIAECRDVIAEASKDADVIISNGIPDLLVLTRDIDLPKIAVSHCSHEWAEQTAKVVHQEALGADVLIGVSGPAYLSFPEHMQQQASIIPLGVDIEHAVPRFGAKNQRKAWQIPENKKIALFLGRMAEVKRPHVLVNAMPYLPDWVAVFVGDGPVKKRIQRMVARGGLDDKVLFSPPVPHVGDVLDAADVLVVPSESEAMPTAVLEAWSAEVPVAMTRCEFAKEIEARHGPMLLKTFQKDAGPKTVAKIIEAAERDQGRTAEYALDAVRDCYTASAMAMRWETHLNKVMSTWMNSVLSPSRAFAAPKAGKKKLHVIWDTKGWAYYHRAKALEKYAPDDWEVTSSNELPYNLESYDIVLLLRCDVVHVVAERIFTHAPHVVLVGGVNVGPGRDEHADAVERCCPYIIHNNKKSWDTRIENPIPGRRHYWISNGVDLQTFFPTVPIEKRQERVLWMGSEYHKELKGFSVISQVDHILLSRGITTDIQLVDSSNPPWSHERMREWYNTGSLFAVLSQSEGTPNPALEAAACGCGLVATEVGNIPELINRDETGQIVPPNGVVPLSNLEPEYVADQIGYAMDLRHELSKNIQNTIKLNGWAWADRSRRYFDLFNHILAADPPPMEWNLAMLGTPEPVTPIEEK